MIRCPKCGHLFRWSRDLLIQCGQCGFYCVMPTQEEAKKAGWLDGVAPPYFWEIDQNEAILVLDALDEMMDRMQALLQRTTDEEEIGSFSGTFLFAKMTRNRLRALCPDLHDKVEVR